METKELIFENLINVASEFRLDEVLEDECYLVETVDVGINLYLTLYSTVYGRDKLTEKLIEKFYYMNKERDFKSKEALKKELKDRIYNNIDSTSIKAKIFEKFNQVIERFQEKKYKDFKQINIVLGLLKEAKILFEDGRNIDVERCLAISMSYIDLLGDADGHTMDIDIIVTLNRLFFPLSYYRNIC